MTSVTIDRGTTSVVSIGTVGPQGPQGPQGATGADSTVAGPAGADGASMPSISGATDGALISYDASAGNYVTVTTVDGGSF